MTAQDLAFNIAAIGGVPLAINVYHDYGILSAIGSWFGVFFAGGIVMTVVFGLMSRAVSR